MTGIVCSNLESIERWGECRWQGLVRLRVLQGVNQRKVMGDLLGCGGLQKELERRIGSRCSGSIGGLGQAICGYDCGGERRRGIYVLKQRPSKRDDRCSCVDGYLSEQGKVFAAMSKGAEMRGGCMSEEDD